jgi:hypothetical protein
VDRSLRRLSSHLRTVSGVPTPSRRAILCPKSAGPSVHHRRPDGAVGCNVEVAHEVVTEVAARLHNVVVLAPGAIPTTPMGKLRRAYRLSLVT